MRTNLRTIRRTHAPRSLAEKRSLDLYRVAIQRFGEQLLRPPAKIDAEQMNELGNRVVDEFVIYMAAYRAAE